MKTDKTKQNTSIKIAALGGILALFVILAGSAVAQLGTSANSSFTTTGNANSNPMFEKFQLAPKSVIDLATPSNPKIIPILDTNMLYWSNKNFRLFGSSFFDTTQVSGDAAFAGKVYIGYPNTPTSDPNVKLLVNGSIIIRQLADPTCVDAATCAAASDVQLCTNDFGTLVRCGI